MPILSYNAFATRLNHWSQFTAGNLAPAAGVVFELRLAGSPNVNIRSPANVRWLDSSLYSQWTTGASSPNGGFYSFRVADGMRHDEILNALRCFDNHVSIMGSRTNNCDTPDVLDFLRQVENLVRMNNISSV